MEFTDWYRLFGMTLTDYFADTAYTVELEKDLSLKKQFLDVVIIEKKEGKQPVELPDGLESMSAHNLISYKSLHEPFDDWSADELVGHFVNYRKQGQSVPETTAAQRGFQAVRCLHTVSRKAD